MFIMLFCAVPNTQHFFPRKKEILLQRGSRYGQGRQALSPVRDSSNTPVDRGRGELESGAQGKDRPVERLLGWKWEDEGRGHSSRAGRGPVRKVSLPDRPVVLPTVGFPSNDAQLLGCGPRQGKVTRSKDQAGHGHLHRTRVALRRVFNRREMVWKQERGKTKKTSLPRPRQVPGCDGKTSSLRELQGSGL